MSNKRIDPRILRTRKLLRQALIELTPQKSFEDITIQDITDQATLNRATFYLHYKDKNELLLDVFERLVTDALPQPPTQLDTFDLNTEGPILAVFDHVAEYANFYRAILGENGVPAFMARIRHIIEGIVLEWLSAANLLDHLDGVDPEVMVNFLAAAYLGVITWWLEKDLPYSAVEMQRQLLSLAPFNPGAPAAG